MELDNLDIVAPIYLANSFKKYISIIYVLEKNSKFLNLNPKCEPPLGKRGLYREIGSKKESEIYILSMLWILNYSDGKNSLLDIANRSKITFDQIKKTADLLLKQGLLKEI